jgi:hypothetical protein
VHICENDKMNMQELQQFISSLRGGGDAAQFSDSPAPDTAEKVQISSLALLKMLKHGIRACLE